MIADAPKKLVDLLGERESQREAHRGLDSDEHERLYPMIPEALDRIKAELAVKSGTRHKDIARIVRVCAEVGATKAEARIAVNKRADLVEKLDEMPHRDDVAELWAKIPPYRAPSPLTVETAADIKLRSVFWLWEDRLPLGTLALLGGREGIGKSLVTCWLAARVSRGELPGVHYGQPRSVIIVAAEDSWSHTIVPRLVAAGADLSKILKVTSGTAASISFPVDIEHLESLVALRGVALIILDPLVSALDVDINPNRERELRRGLEPVQQMASRTGCVVVGITHFGKTAGRDALSLFMGNRALSAVSRSALACARMPDEPSFVLSQVKNNLGRMDLPHLAYRTISATVETADGESSVGRIVFDGETSVGVEEILSSTGDREAPKRKECAEMLLAYLTSRGGEAPASDCQKVMLAEGFSKSTIFDARKQAKIKSHRVGFGSGSLWQLPDYEPPSTNTDPLPASFTDGLLDG